MMFSLEASPCGMLIQCGIKSPFNELVKFEAVPDLCPNMDSRLVQALH